MASEVTHALITDVVCRDGFQIEKTPVSTADKVLVARGLMEAGLESLEVAAFVRRDAVPQMADSEEVLAELRGSSAALYSLVFNESGARRAIAAGAQHVRLILSA